MPVNISNDQLRRFVGGAIHIKNDLEGYEFQGTIQTIELDGSELRMHFSEIRRLAGVPSDDEKLDHEISLDWASEVNLERTKLYIDSTPVVWEKITITCSAEAEATAEPIEFLAPLNTAQMQTFVGADIEIHAGSGAKTDAWRGPIASVSIVDGVLNVVCAWVGFLPKASFEWKVSDKKEFRWPLSDYLEPTHQDGRIILAHRQGMDRGVIVFMAPGKNLDPAKVVGLVL